MTRMLLAAAGYVVIVFPLALGWHLGLFEEQHMETAYLAVQFGLFALVLALIYRRVE